jgi:hypothetical protein
MNNITSNFRTTVNFLTCFVVFFFPELQYFFPKYLPIDSQLITSRKISYASLINHN